MRTGIFLFFCLFAPSLVFADIYNCNGVWKNQPCEDRNSLPSMVESEKIIDPSEKAKKEKKALFNTLDTKAFDARRNLRVNVDISRAREACYNETTSLEYCRNAVKEHDEELSKKISEEKALRASKEKEAEKKEPEAEKISLSDQQLNITVWDDEDRDDRHHKHRKNEEEKDRDKKWDRHDKGDNRNRREMHKDFGRGQTTSAGSKIPTFPN